MLVHLIGGSLATEGVHSLGLAGVVQHVTLHGLVLGAELHHGALHILPVVVRDPYLHVEAVHPVLLEERGSDLAGYLEVHLVGDALVGEVVLAAQLEAEVGGGDDAIVVLMREGSKVGCCTVSRRLCGSQW